MPDPLLDEPVAPPVEPPPEPVEEETPGLLTPIREQGLGQGLLTLGEMMIPGSYAGGQAAERSRDGFSLGDLFATAKDFGEEVSYGTPGLGEVQGFRSGVEILGQSSDWLTKALGVLGVSAPGLSAAGVIGLPIRARAAALQPGRQAAATTDVLPVVTRYLDNDALARISGTFDHPVVDGGILATSTDTSQQVLVALHNFTGPFDETQRVYALRVAVTGHVSTKTGRWNAGRPKNKKQVEGFIYGLGEALVNRVRGYRTSTTESVAMDAAKVRVAAAGQEMSKFDTAVRRGMVTTAPEFADAADIWGRLKAGKSLTDVELNDLTAAFIEFAEVTESLGHPQLALSDPRFALTGVHLGGAKKGVSLAPVGFDALPPLAYTNGELIGRMNLLFQHSPETSTSIAMQNMVDFFDDKDHGVRHNWDNLKHAVIRYAEAHPAVRQQDVQMVPISELERLPSAKNWKVDTTRKNFLAMPEAVRTDWSGFTDNIRLKGIDSPISVEWHPGHGYAVVVDGHHRIAAAKQIGLEAVPVKVKLGTNVTDPGPSDGSTSRKITGIKQVTDKDKMPKQIRPTSVGIRSAPGAYRGIIPEPARQMGAGVHWYGIAGEETGSLAQFHGLNHERLVGFASLLSAGELWEGNLDKGVVAALWYKNHPGADVDQFMHYMNSEGMKVTKGEAKNVVDMMKVADADIEQYFYNMLGGDKALKQPNFVMAIMHSTADDQVKASALAYAMYRGQIPATEAHGLFRELDFDVPVVVDRHALAIAAGFSFLPGGTFSDNVYAQVRRAIDAAAVAVGPMEINGVERLLSPSEMQAVLWVQWREWRGLTKNYKVYRPAELKRLRQPALFVDGYGPNQKYSNRLHQYLVDPLPQEIAWNGVARQGRGVYMTPEQLAGRFNPSGTKHRHFDRATPRGRRPSGKPSAHEISLSMTEDGMHVVKPEGAAETTRNTYPSYGWTEDGQIRRASTPMSVADIDTQQALLAGDGVVLPRSEGRTASTGVQRFTSGHRNPAFEEGHHIAMSAARSNGNNTERARPGHHEMEALLKEREINFTSTIEEAHTGPALVWLHEGREYWSRRDVIDAGLNPDLLKTTMFDEGDRVRMVLSFPDYAEQSKALMVIQEYVPHRATAVEESVRGAMGYIERHGKELLLGLPRGIKREARMGTLTTDPVGPRRTIFDEARSAEVAAAYDAAPVMPSKKDLRATKRAYRQLVRETSMQYDYITNDLGITVEVTKRNPYETPNQMMRDIIDNKHLSVYSTRSTGGHPMMTDWENDMFRIVHDFFGHAGLGNTFTRHGETVAYLKHSQMYSELARSAMFSETIGQNSALIVHGDFQPQKAVILDRKFWSNDVLQNDAGYLKGSDQGRRMDRIYGEEILDLTAYTNGDHEIPFGMIGAYEHHWTDPVGRRIVQMSGDGGTGRANVARVFVVEHDGMWSYFKDAQSLRHQPGGGAVGRPATRPLADPVEGIHRITEANGSVWWDNTAKILNPEQIRGIKVLSDIEVPSTVKHMFDVEVDGKVTREIALYIPDEGSGAPELFYNRRTIPNRPSSRVVVLTRSGGEFRRGTQVLNVEYPPGLIHSNLKDDVYQFLERTGWVGEMKDIGKGI